MWRANATNAATTVTQGYNNQTDRAHTHTQWRYRQTDRQMDTCLVFQYHHTPAVAVMTGHTLSLIC